MTRYPLHPAIVHFPLACWVLATLLDIGHLLAFERFFDSGLDWSAAAQLLLWVGLLAAVPTVAAGVFDYVSLPRAVQDGAELMRHVAWMGSALMLFFGAALWRVGMDTFAPPDALYIVALEIVGSICLVAGGHYASVVVFRRLPEHAASSETKTP